MLLVIHRKIDAGNIVLAPKLRFLQRCGLGYDSIDVASATVAGGRRSTSYNAAMPSSPGLAEDE